MRILSNKRVIAFFLLLSFWHIIPLVIGCGTCPPVPDMYFDILGVSSENRLYYPREEMRGRHVAEKYEHVELEKLFITILFDHNWRVAQSFGLISQATATSCDDGYVGSRDTLKSITAVTNYDFNDEIGQGDTINQFLSFLHYEVHYLEYGTWKDTLRSDDFSYEYPLFIQPENSFQLLTSPTKSDTVSISFTYEFYSGATYSVTSPEVILKK